MKTGDSTVRVASCAEVRADGKMYKTSERLRLDRFREHDVEIVVGVLDKKRARPGSESSLQAVHQFAS